LKHARGSAIVVPVEKLTNSEGTERSNCDGARIQRRMAATNVGQWSSRAIVVGLYFPLNLANTTIISCRAALSNLRDPIVIVAPMNNETFDPTW
jgi:hypothetical protein